MRLHFCNQNYESVLIKDHAAMRMLYRNISQKELSELLVAGEVVEDYPNDFPFPSKLIFKLVNNRPLHAVVAMDTEKKVLIIVTVYEPDSEKFESDFITRKKT
jgi:hypothetical protein